MRQALAQQFAQLGEHRIAHVHAGLLVDDVQLIYIDVQRTPRLRGLVVRDRAHAPLESRSGVQAAERIVTALDDADGLAGEDLGDVGIAFRESVRARLAQQCEHTDEAAGARAQRAAQHPVRQGVGRCGRQSFVAHHRLALRLRQRQQPPVSAHQELRVGRRVPAGAHQRDVALRNEQRPGAGVQVLDGLLQQYLQLVGPVGRGNGLVGAAVGEQQVQILVEPADGVVELIDGGACDEFAPQAFQHGTQQRVSKGEIVSLRVLRVLGAAHDGDNAEEPLGVIAQRAQVHGQIAGQHAHLARAVRVRACAHQCVIDDVHQIRARHGLAGPGDVARGPEHRDARRARQQAAYEAHVGLETGPRPAGDVIAV